MILNIMTMLMVNLIAVEEEGRKANGKSKRVKMKNQRKIIQNQKSKSKKKKVYLKNLIEKKA